MKQNISGVYAITDSKLIPVKKFAANLKQALEGGANIIQYRDKSRQHELRWQQAKIMVDLCKEYGAISIVNDDIELAKVIDADGVHLGAEDDSVEFARAELGESKIIGVSCYSDLSLAKKMALASADYVAFGSIYASPTKPEAKVAGIEILQQAKNSLTVPVVAIGGVSIEKMPELLSTKVDSVAVISGIFASEDIKMATQQYSQFFRK